MIEGMAQGGLGANWGDGHATDASLMSRIAANANPNTFYQQLVTAQYANNAIISTHVYGCALLPPSVAVRPRLLVSSRRFARRTRMPSTSDTEL